MTTVAASHGRPAAAERPAWRQVALPSEHGGWSLTAEPVLLGLVVAWSGAGLALGVAAMLAFVARTPVKLVLVDRWRRRALPRTTLAARVSAVEIAAIAALGVVAFATAYDGRWWIPLAAAAPLVIVELWFDMRSKGRRLVPELAGTVGIGSIAAAIAMAGGLAADTSLGLWLVVAARGGAAIPYVRTQIFRLHGRPAQRGQADVAQGLAVVAVVAGWAVGAVPVAAAAAVAVAALANVVLVRRAAKPAKVIGMQQMVFGIVVVAVTAASVISS